MVLPKDRTQRVAPFYHKSLHASSFIDCLWILRKTTRIHSMEEELDDGCRSWYFQQGMCLSCCPPDSRCKRCNVDNAWLKSERLFNGLCLLTCWERSTNFVCIENILILSFDRWNLVLQDRPICDKRLDLDHVRAGMHEIQDLSRSDRGPLWISSWSISFLKLWARWHSFFSGVFPYLGHEVFPS